MKEEVLSKIMNMVRNLREDSAVGLGGAANYSGTFSGPINSLAKGNIAGTSQAGDYPPVDLRKKKYKNLPLLYKDLFRRKKNV